MTTRHPASAALLLALLCGVPACAGAAPSPGAAPPAAGEVAGPVEIGDGRHLYLECRGPGGPASGPTVILESGYHDSADLWTVSDVEPPVAAEPVLPGIARTARVCAYDRPGTLRYTERPGTVTDRTSPAPMPRTAGDVVADLHALLTAARVPGPYILVAHSLGGVFARLYAQTYPDDVVGLVLVDTFSPEVPRIFGATWPAYRDLLSSTGTQGDPAAERVDLDTSIAQLQQAPTLRPLPVAVLSKTEPFGGLPPTMPAGLTAEDIERFWPQVQAGVVRIQPRTPQTLATGSDHYIQVRQPDLVITAHRLVAQRAATGR